MKAGGYGTREQSFASIPAFAMGVFDDVNLPTPRDPAADALLLLPKVESADAVTHGSDRHAGEQRADDMAITGDDTDAAQ
ncbi:MAG: hypothetical protein IPK39_24100 [Sulfuritalea sp.]|nr:hypothetical protein [Sulfuritalea sp.]